MVKLMIINYRYLLITSQLLEMSDDNQSLQCSTILDNFFKSLLEKLRQGESPLRLSVNHPHNTKVDIFCKSFRGDNYIMEAESYTSEGQHNKTDLVLYTERGGTETKDKEEVDETKDKEELLENDTKSNRSFSVRCGKYSTYIEVDNIDRTVEIRESTYKHKGHAKFYDKKIHKLLTWDYSGYTFSLHGGSINGICITAHLKVNFSSVDVHDIQVLYTMMDNKQLYKLKSVSTSYNNVQELQKFLNKYPICSLETIEIDVYYFYNVDFEALSNFVLSNVEKGRKVIVTSLSCDSITLVKKYGSIRSTLKVMQECHNIKALVNSLADKIVHFHYQLFIETDRINQLTYPEINVNRLRKVTAYFDQRNHENKMVMKISMGRPPKSAKSTIY